MRRLVRPTAFAALCALAGCVGAPVAYAPPPGYAAPPPAGYSQPYQQGYAPSSPPPQDQVALGGRCYAGVYVCDLAQGLPVGSQCSCPGLGAPSYGVVR